MLIFFKNSFFPPLIPKKPWFSRNPISEGFGENFLETKRKSTSRNPYEPEENLIRSAIFKIAYTNFLVEHAYYGTIIRELRYAVFFRYFLRVLKQTENEYYCV